MTCFGITLYYSITSKNEVPRDKSLNNIFYMNKSAVKDSSKGIQAQRLSDEDCNFMECSVSM